MANHREQLDAYLDRLDERLPTWAKLSARWLRKPSAIWVRFPLGLLLIVGGVFSFLPVLGIWMLPLGLIFIAIDVPFLQKPVVRGLQVVERWWERWQARRGNDI